MNVVDTLSGTLAIVSLTVAFAGLLRLLIAIPTSATTALVAFALIAYKRTPPAPPSPGLRISEPYPIV